MDCDDYTRGIWAGWLTTATATARRDFSGIGPTTCLTVTWSRMPSPPLTLTAASGWLTTCRALSGSGLLHRPAGRVHHCRAD